MEAEIKIKKNLVAEATTFKYKAFDYDLNSSFLLSSLSVLVRLYGLQ